MVAESTVGKDVRVEVTTFYQEGGDADFDAGIKEWMNANPDALTNNGGNDMVSACIFSTARRSSPSAGTTFSAWRGLPLFSFRRSAG